MNSLALHAPSSSLEARTNSSTTSFNIKKLGAAFLGAVVGILAFDPTSPIGVIASGTVGAAAGALLANTLSK